MTKYLDSNNIVTECQHGFVAGHSCLTNLLEVFEDWMQCLDGGYNIKLMLYTWTTEKPSILFHINV